MISAAKLSFLVDYRTKLRCYKEMKKLYGLQNGQNIRYMTAQSIDRAVLSEDEIAKEIGFSKTTLERMEKIEISDLPEEIKDAKLPG